MTSKVAIFAIFLLSSSSVSCGWSIWRQDGVASKQQQGPEAPVATTEDYAAQLDRECSIVGECLNVERYGDVKVSYGTSRGYFPTGCRWREVFANGSYKGLEYWNESNSAWDLDRPPACALQVCTLSADPVCPRGDAWEGVHGDQALLHPLQVPQTLPASWTILSARRATTSE